MKSIELWLLKSKAEFTVVWSINTVANTVLLDSWNEKEEEQLLIYFDFQK